MYSALEQYIHARVNPLQHIYRTIEELPQFFFGVNTILGTLGGFFGFFLGKGGDRPVTHPNMICVNIYIRLIISIVSKS